MIASATPPAVGGGRPFRWNAERRDELLAGLGGLRPYGRTGFQRLDDLLGGGLSCGLHVISALPGVGKTSFALQIGDRIARLGNGKVIFVALEMTGSALAAKSISRICTENGTPMTFSEIISLSRRGGGGGGQRFEALARAVDQYFQEIGPSVATIDWPVTVKELAALYDVLPAGEPKPLCVVDYLQLVPRDAAEGAQAGFEAISANVRELCDLAQRHSVPIVLVCAQNRSTKRGTPSMDALAGSASIEFAATSISFLSVDGDTDEERARNAELSARPVTLFLLKSRYGRLGRVPLWFNAAHNVFTERA